MINGAPSPGRSAAAFAAGAAFCEEPASAKWRAFFDSCREGEEGRRIPPFHRGGKTLKRVEARFFICGADGEALFDGMPSVRATSGVAAFRSFFCANALP
ncbi:MAG TPA: hypothetical protein IAB50_12150 [Candidatus Faecivicinus avistercoris]|nr:hypothetical protein [Candidatus Faecivicinus avistercoris]